MNRRWRSGFAALAAALALVGTEAMPAAAAAAAAAAPQDPSEPTEPADTTDRPFVAGGVYDRPYLGRLLGRTAIGGYAEVHARHERADGVKGESGFVARRFNLFTATRVSDFVRMGAELEIEDGGEEVKLEYAAIDVIIHASFTLRGGMILSPLGRFNLAHDSPLNPFTDRPLVSTDLLGVALSEPGFGALGTIGLGGLGGSGDRAGQGRVTYEIYATNGFHDGLILDSPDGTRLAAGRGNFEDQNGSPAVVGRVAWSPRSGQEVGVSAHHGAWNVFALDGEGVDERRDLTVVVADLETGLAGLEVTAEAALVRLDVPPSLENIAARRQAGGYVDFEYPFLRGVPATMPNATLSAKLRLDAVDFDQDRAGDGVVRVSVGFNFRPTADTVLKAEYVRGRERDRFNSPAETVAFLFSIATYF